MISTYSWVFGRSSVSAGASEDLPFLEILVKLDPDACRKLARQLWAAADINEAGARPGTFEARGTFIGPSPSHPTPDDPSNLHPSVLGLLAWFRFEHLPARLQQVSAPFARLAWQIARRSVVEACDGAETSAALRKLLEAKDAAVRAALRRGPWTPDGLLEALLEEPAVPQPEPPATP